VPGDPVAEVVAGRGAEDANGDDQRQPKLAAPGEISAHHENGFFRDGNSGGAQQDQDEDRGIAPMADQLGGIDHDP
jgi:hypothetical protein